MEVPNGEALVFFDSIEHERLCTLNPPGLFLNGGEGGCAWQVEEVVERNVAVFNEERDLGDGDLHGDDLF